MADFPPFETADLYNPLRPGHIYWRGLDAVQDWFSPPGGDGVARGAVMAQTPEAIIPSLVEAGIEPPNVSGMGMSATGNPNDPVWAGMALQTAAKEAVQEAQQDSGNPLDALKGVKMPTAPEPYIPKIGAPSPYNPGAISMPNIGGLLAQVSGQAKAPLDLLRLRPAILGGR